MHPRRDNYGGSYSRNTQKGPPRERNTRPAQRSNYHSNVNDSRAVQLLIRIIGDHDDSSFARRLTDANQLLKSLEDSRNTVSDSLEFRQEQMQLLDICIHDEGLKRTIEFAKAPNTLKTSLRKIVSGLACYTRLDLTLSWLFEKLLSMNEYDECEWKKWLLLLLKQLLVDSMSDPYTYKQMQEMLPVILSSIISFLNTMDSSEYLISVMDILLFFAENQQNLFAARFNEIIDLMLGWNMDPGLSDSERQVMLSSYEKFAIFWASYLPFGVELLGHFVNDISTNLKSNAQQSRKLWDKCINIFSCFEAILNAVLPSITTLSNYHTLKVVEPPFTKLLPSVLSLVQDAQTLNPDEQWTSIAKHVLSSLCSYKPRIYRAHQNKLYQYLVKQPSSYSNSDCQSYIESLMQFLNLWGNDIEEDIIFSLLDSDTSSLFNIRTHCRDDQQLNTGILTLLRFLIRLRVSDDTRIEINFRFVKKFIQNQTVIKKQYSSPLTQCGSILKQTTRLIEQNEGSTVFTLPFEHVESIYAVEDTLFYNFLLLEMATVWPDLRFENCLNSLEMLCVAWYNKCSDIFDSCVQLMTNFWKNIKEDDHQFEMMACVITDLLEYWSEINLKTRTLLCEFIKQLFKYHDHKSDFKPIMTNLLHAAEVERNYETKESLLKVITYYCQTFGSAEIINCILEYIQKSINHPSAKVQSATKGLLSNLNPFMVSEVEKYDDNCAAFIQSIIMATPHTGSFRPVHYEIVMKQIGMSEHLISSDDHTTDDEWARRLLHHCDTISNMKNVNIFGELSEDMDLGGIIDVINNNQALLYYWAMWESARYCILSRLRTPFGGPQQTFAAFERMLQSLISGNNQNIDFLRHLLLLLDRLELQISNASDGCATGTLPAVPRSSLVFFRTNKKTCHDYFLRIRSNIIKGAKIVQNDHLLIAHTLQILKEKESTIPANDVVSWFKEVNGYLVDLVAACIRERYMDLIYGMQSWYKRVIRKIQHNMPEFKDSWSFEGYVGPLPKQNESSSTVTWFHIAALFASGNEESAIKSLTALKSIVAKDHYGVLQMLDRQAVYFYSCLQDYESLQKVIDTDKNVIDDFIYESLRSFNSESNEVSESEMQSFVKSTPLESCIALSQLDKFNDWLVTSKMQTTFTNSVKERILQVLKDGIFENMSCLLELQLLETDWRNLLLSSNDWVRMNSNNLPNFHKVPPETKHWARLTTYFGKMIRDNDATSGLQNLGLIALHSAKVARRQGNNLLAEKLTTISSEIPTTKYPALYEQTKVLFLKSDYTQAMQKANEVLTYVTSVPDFEELKSKTFLKIARYLKSCPDREVSNLLGQLDPGLVRMQETHLESSVEVSINYALEKSIENNTIDGRPWFEYATHYYKSSWRILDDMLKPNPSVQAVIWATEKMEKVLKSSDTRKSIFGLFLKYTSVVGNRALSSSANFMNEFHQIVSEPSDEAVIIETLETLQEMVIGKFHASTQAYFQYLSLGIHTVEKDSNIGSTSMVITATLRLLRILTKYGGCLQSVFREHIDTVRIDLWKSIIPQLFAQLNHPSDFVREIISKLISRICDEYPREIVYDVIVNSTSSKTNRDTKQSLNAIANRMMERNELLWVSTRRMAEELEKITVLVEERWMNKIASLQYDVMQQFTKLDQTIENIEKSDLDESQKEKNFREIYDSVMKFTIISIDKLLMETTATSTSHEQWFQKTYGKQLIHACHLLQNPTSRKDYRQGWETFQQLHRRLMTEIQKVRVLELSQISPFLSNMKNTPIGMPGNQQDESCFIQSFGKNVIVLPTKTKPKKLDVKGSDGKTYSYLFKGLEDLHLDERIMQLLTTTNGLLSENKNTALDGMRARTYAVIPLSDHSGMIQWVNDATPFFALYKKWQKRESTAHMLLSNDKPNEAFMQKLLQRPTEQFTSKVASVLKAAGLRVTANRRYWPKDVLKKVYIELQKETPGDLLEKELYYSSSSPTDWFKKSSSFARSLAVTSMIGYIIGLGDRHLDNILIDFRSGEVIHIDYNVCFEKGKRLRVPELIPYRLTQNLYGGLGITGVEGRFKIAAEETLRVLRKHKEVLITLLDAFVYDPLVDWESEAVEANHRQMIELQANLTLVATRILEKQQEQEGQRKNILESLSGLEYFLQQWNESMLLESETLNAEDEIDNDEQVLEGGSSLADNAYTGRIPIYLLRDVKEQLGSVISLISNARASVGGISSILESIIITETDEDNELRPAQNSAKMALDSLALLDSELKKLDNQVKNKVNYESEWSYSQLEKFLGLIKKSVESYFTALRTLEEFGPDSTKTSALAATNTDDKEEYNEGSQDVSNNSNTSQSANHLKPASNAHVTKIMKRIRSKLEGVDFGIQHKMSVNEQVSRSIDQAMSVDNLCMMYEGWTSWV